MSRFAAGICGSLHETVVSQPGFEHFYNLEYDKALSEFSSQAMKDPTSADAYNHIAQPFFIGNVSRRNAFQRLYRWNEIRPSTEAPLSEADTAHSRML